jgi:hypothetical protein
MILEQVVDEEGKRGQGTYVNTEVHKLDNREFPGN